MFGQFIPPTVTTTDLVDFDQDQAAEFEALQARTLDVFQHLQVGHLVALDRDPDGRPVQYYWNRDGYGLTIVHVTHYVDPDGQIPGDKILAMVRPGPNGWDWEAKYITR